MNPRQYIRTYEHDYFDDSTTSFLGAPRLSDDLIVRERLLSSLAAKSPLTVCRGPSGSGKTTLVAQYVKDNPSRGLWISAGCPTSGRHSLWVTAAQTLAKQYPHIASLAEAVGETPDLRAALARIFAHAEVNTLVIDDLDSCKDAEQVAEDVFHLLQDCPLLRAIVVTRTRGYLEGALVGARITRTVISPTALLLTPDESSRMITAGTVEPGVGDTLHDACGGHVLLLRAMIVGVRNRASGETIPQVAARVVGEMLRNVDAECRAFMLDTSVPEEFDLQLARELSSNDAPDKTLDSLERDGILTRVERRGDPLWRYHAIIREGLLEQASETAAVQRAARRTTARWHLEQGRPHEAVRYGMDAEAYDLVSEALLADGMRLIFQGGAYEACAHLKPKDVARHPLIAFTIATGCYVRRSRRFSAQEYFEATIAGVRLSSGRKDDAKTMALLTVEAISLRRTGRSSQGVAPARQALKLLREPRADFSRLDHQLGWLRLENALNLVSADKTDEAWDALHENAVDLDALPPSIAFQTLSAAAYLHTEAGDFSAAQEAIEVATQLDMPLSALNGHEGALYHLARGFIAFESFDTQAVRAEVQALALHLETLEFRAQFLALEALADLISGHAPRGLQRIAKYLRSQRRSRITLQETKTLAPVQIVLHLAEGQGVQAQEILKKVSGGSRCSLERFLSALARHLTDDKEAINELAGMDLSEISSRQATMMHLIWGAASLRHGEEETAARHVRHLLAVMMESGMRSHLVLVPRQELEGLHALAVSSGCENAEILSAEHVPTAMPDSRGVPHLTERELVVLHALAKSPETAEIADALVVSRNTVKSQLRSLYRKLGVVSREQALSVARLHGLLQGQRGTLR